MILVMPTQWERTDGRGGRKERTLSAWRRFAGHVSRLGLFYLIDSPPFFLSLWKMHPFDPFFFPFQKACFGHVLPTVLNVTVSNPVFGTVPVLSLCFSVRDLFPSGQFNSVYWTKPKTVKECVRTPPVLCAVAINNGDKRSVLLICRYIPISWQYPDAIST